MNKARREGLVYLAIGVGMLTPVFVYLGAVDYDGASYPAWAHALAAGFGAYGFGFCLVGWAQFTSGKTWEGLGLRGDSPLKLRPKRGR